MRWGAEREGLEERLRAALEVNVELRRTLLETREGRHLIRTDTPRVVELIRTSYAVERDARAAGLFIDDELALPFVDVVAIADIAGLMVEDVIVMVDPAA